MHHRTSYADLGLGSRLGCLRCDSVCTVLFKVGSGDICFHTVQVQQESFRNHDWQELMLVLHLAPVAAVFLHVAEQFELFVSHNIGTA